jgi:hypothetical protein
MLLSFNLVLSQRKFRWPFQIFNILQLNRTTWFTRKRNIPHSLPAINSGSVLTATMYCVFSTCCKWRIYKRYVNNTSNPLKFPTPYTHCLAVNVQVTCPLVSVSNVTCCLVTKWNCKWPLLWVKPDVPIGLRVRIECPFAWVKIHVSLRLRVTIHMSLGLKWYFTCLTQSKKSRAPLSQSETSYALLTQNETSRATWT